jgi:hypothetical protein
MCDIGGRMESEFAKTDEELIQETAGLRQFATELANRYGVVPESPVVDVEFHPNHRVLHVKEPIPGKQEEEFRIVKVRTKSNCKKCYGFGYTALFESNEEDLRNKPQLDFCSCLRPVKEDKEKEDDQQEGSGPPGT